MAIEVEVKARVRDPDGVRERLARKAGGEPSTYRDTYYDWPDRRLTREGRQELRVRRIEAESGTRCVLTFKGAMLDGASTPELETDVDSCQAVDAILKALGLEHLIAYTKQCQNFRFAAEGHRIVATLVRVPEIDGTFIEVETLIPADTDTAAAQQVIGRVLADLGLGDGDLEPTFYIDMVTASRAAG